MKKQDKNQKLKKKRHPKIVKPIKDQNVLNDVMNCLLHDFDCGERNYMIFEVGKATMLRISDLMNLKKSDVYLTDDDGNLKREVQINAYTRDIKTGKNNVLYLEPIELELLNYYDYLKNFETKYPTKKVFSSKWLFPSFTKPEKTITTHRYYLIMQKVGKKLGINYLGTHTCRKTGAWDVYEQSGHDIALVMDLLKHSSEKITLKYLGLDQEHKENVLRQINFGSLNWRFNAKD